MLLYRVLRFVLRIAVSVFFKEIWVQGRERLPDKGPLIIAVNHPNTMMDPFVVLLQFKQRSGFLAKGSLFRSRLVKWIFGKLHLIPVYRPQDVKEGQAVSNSDSFRKCYEYLKKGGTLMIFPEGNSINEMKLRKLKTGTARIALETAAQQNFASGLQIAPVALNYSDPIRFRSRLSMLVEKPIAVDAFAEIYRADPAAAVQLLTEELCKKLQKNLITAESSGQELLLKRIKKLYYDHLVYTHGSIVSKQEEFELMQQIALGLKYYQLEQPQDCDTIAEKVNTYFDMVSETGLKAGIFARNWGRGRILMHMIANMLLLFLLLPFYMLGLVSNYLPYHLPARIASALGTDIEYRAGIMMLSGLFLFPLYYLLFLFLLFKFVYSGWIFILLCAFALPILGFFTLFYWRIAEQAAGMFNYLRLGFARAGLLQSLIALRLEVVHELEQAATTLAATRTGN